MKILFVRSGNVYKDPISTLQGLSLSKAGVDMYYYDVVGKGFWGYLCNVGKLSSYIRKIRPDIIHAHYSFCGYLVCMTFPKQPVITSLMGSDINNSNFNWITRLFSRLCWKETIVKTEKLKKKSGIVKAHVIPNGVDLDMFHAISKNIAREHLKWDLNNNIILFAANPNRPEKNWKLAEKAINHVKQKNEVKSLAGIPTEEMVYYYNAADVVLLTSPAEGSPNVIKEAMACNRPIVTTNVGDTEWILGNTDGCYLTTNDVENIAKNIENALDFSIQKVSTAGRERIAEIGLNSSDIAQKLIYIYQKILQ